MKRVVVRIERLVLRGIRPEDRRAVAAGVEQELARRFAAPGAADHLARTGHIERLNVGRVKGGAVAKPRQVGRAAAAAIGGRLGVDDQTIGERGLGSPLSRKWQT